MNTLRINPKTKIFTETGSALDATEISKIKVSLTFLVDCWHVFDLISFFCIVQTRAGSHDIIPTRQIDESAFSYSKKNQKPDPSNFTRRGEGNGGTMVPKPKPVLTSAEIAQNKIKNKQPRLLTKPAFCARPNPPNTELRRFA